MRLWALIDDGEFADDFYATREEAEAALEAARARDNHPEDAAVLARLRVEPIDSRPRSLN